MTTFEVLTLMIGTAMLVISILSFNKNEKK
ncbi:putative holin-like toxin [Alkalihalophilus marmarensis]